ncbi:autotransporter domain-containing protein [Glaesserella parasuis]|uniref:autotransporter domain-containing protein n=2 Tax=Glaesserella parasuis TaxID=738 RepID=UPI003B67297C
MYFRKSSLALAILLCLSPMTVTNANAETYVVTGENNNMRGEQFLRLLNQAKDGDTIRLNGDTQLLRGSGFFNVDKQVTIDGQGNRLHLEGYNLSLGQDVTFSNMNLSLKPSRDLNIIFGSGFNMDNLEAKPTYIVTNGNKLTLDNVTTNVYSEPSDTRPIIWLGNADTTKSNNGHNALIVTNSNSAETKLYSVIVDDNTESGSDTSPIDIQLGEYVGLVDAIYLAGVDNVQEHNRAINFTSSSNAVTKIYTGDTTNVSVTLNNVNPSNAIVLQDVKDLTLNNSRITLDKNLSVSEMLTLNDQSAITAVASKDAFGDVAKTSLMLNNVHTNDNNSKITIVQDNTLLINGNITGELTINTEDKDNNVSLPNGSTLVGKNGSYVVKPQTDTSATGNDATPPATTANTATDSSNTDTTPATTAEQTGSSDTTATSPAADISTTSNETTPPATTGDTATNSSNTDATSATAGEQTGSSDTTVTPPAADTSTTSNETTSPATTENTATDSSNTDTIPATTAEQTGSSDTTVGTSPADTSAMGNDATPPATTANTATDSSNTDTTPATTAEQTGSSDTTATPPAADTSATGNDATAPATTENTATDSSNTDTTPATTGEQTGSSDTTATPPTDTAQTGEQADTSSSETTTSTSAQPTDATAPTNGQTETSSASANHNKITITTAEQETQRTIAESRYATLVSNFALNSIRNRLEHSRSSDAYPYLTATVNGMIPTVSELGGLWVNSSSDRITQERYKFNNFGLQVGYDKSSALDNGTARFGFALDVEKGKTNFAQFSETYKTQTYGMALYGAYETEERHYFDVAVRMAKASSELKSNASQTYHHNLYSASLAYSKGFELSNRWEIEPYTQLFYTHLSSTNYIKNGLNVTADEINSLVGSVGTKAEYQLNQTLNFYTKVAMHREFNATQDINIIRSATDRVQHNINHRGTWTTLGLGMKARLGNNTHLYLDVDKLFGNGYKQSYQINLGLDWKF